MRVDLLHVGLVFYVLGRQVCATFDGGVLLAGRSYVTPANLFSIIAGPVMSPEVVGPSIEGGVAVAGHVLTGHGVVGESKVLLVGDLDLEALIVDDGPESYVTVLVHGLIREHQLHGQRAGDGTRAESGTVEGTVEVGRPDEEFPGAEYILVSAVGWCVTRHHAEGARRSQNDR